MRYFSLWLSNTIIFAFIVGIIVEIYLVFGTFDVISGIMSLYVGYFLLINLTMLPECIIVIVKEHTMNMLERNAEMSVPGQYFSLIEYYEESLGLYGDDTRLHDHVLGRIDEFYELLGLFELEKEFPPTGYTMEWFKNRFRVADTFD